AGGFASGNQGRFRYDAARFSPPPKRDTHDLEPDDCHDRTAGSRPPGGAERRVAPARGRSAAEPAASATRPAATAPGSASDRAGGHFDAPGATPRAASKLADRAGAEIADPRLAVRRANRAA